MIFKNNTIKLLNSIQLYKIILSSSWVCWQINNSSSDYVTSSIHHLFTNAGLKLTMPGVRKDGVSQADGPFIADCIRYAARNSSQLYCSMPFCSDKCEQRIIACHQTERDDLQVPNRWRRVAKEKDYIRKHVIPDQLICCWHLRQYNPSLQTAKGLLRKIVKQPRVWSL